MGKITVLICAILLFASLLVGCSNVDNAIQVTSIKDVDVGYLGDNVAVITVPNHGASHSYNNYIAQCVALVVEELHHQNKIITSIDFQNNDMGYNRIIHIYIIYTDIALKEFDNEQNKYTRIY